MRNAFFKAPKRLTEKDRVVITAIHKAGYPNSGTVTAIGVSPSTISKELGRNRGYDGDYRATMAQVKYLARFPLKNTRFGAFMA